MRVLICNEIEFLIRNPSREGYVNLQAFASLISKCGNKRRRYVPHCSYVPSSLCSPYPVSSCCSWLGCGSGQACLPPSPLYRGNVFAENVPTRRREPLLLISGSYLLDDLWELWWLTFINIPVQSVASFISQLLPSWLIPVLSFCVFLFMVTWCRSSTC